MAQGHVIPMIDTTKIFTSRGLKVTVVTTPLNAPLFSKNLHCSFPSIAVETLDFPAAAAGMREFRRQHGLRAVTKFFVTKCSDGDVAGDGGAILQRQVANGDPGDWDRGRAEAAVRGEGGERRGGGCGGADDGEGG
ncbi:unnamed protein product [Linum tenue]|uniref:Uncharacterized protein n=1 Tax=Linum tenue TaxID=586396 RepID=A0AAV0MNN3_9ROSI|nr:unnamed protein product [Linum tenue]